MTQSFAPQDETTREYLSKLSGLRTYWLKTAGGNVGENLTPGHAGQNVGQSWNWAHMQGPELWGKGLARMEMGQSVMFNLGHNFRAFLPDPEDAKLMPHTKAMLDAAKAAAAGGNARPQASTGGRVVVSCPNCRAQARVPSDRRTIEVKCPSCETKWVYDPANT